MRVLHHVAPEVGQIVSVRSRSWVVADVLGNALPDRPQHLVDLVSIEDDAQGETLQVLWEVEPGAHAPEHGTLPEVVGFDPPGQLDAFLDAVRWGAIATADVKRLQSPFRAGIQIEDYQLDPVARALDMPRVNLLIADDVGLGKTVEAGLVALELILGHRAQTILVVCKPSLQIQWRDQMRDKFGLEFKIIDRELFKALRRSRGIHANPWTHFPRLITSYDFLKRDQPMRLMRDALPAPGEPRYPRRFDLLIVDEAHNIAPSGGGRYATESDRTRAVRELTPHFEHKLFLSATPHNGYPESFSALLELLDNQRFARSVPPDKAQLAAVMVRRLKSELTEWTGERRFPPRRLEPIEVAYTAAEREAHARLEAYAMLRRRRAQGDAERVAAEFVLKLLKKRLFSSPIAFSKTLDQHLRTLAGPRQARPARPALGVLQGRLDAALELVEDDEETEETIEDALVAAAEVQDLGPEERRVLAELQTWAGDAANRPDEKARTLLQWLDTHIRPHGRWSDARVIIFTEYLDTLNWLFELLAAAGYTSDGRTLQIFGGMDSDAREAVKAAFQTSPEVSNVRILLATDAAAEGLDFQNFCHQIIHYEIPWNPNRLEQRNGRVDRHGQNASEVLIYHFVGAGYDAASNVGRPPGDLEGDLEFLARAAVKVNQIREDLGSAGPVLATQVERAMLGDRAVVATVDGLRADPKTTRAKRELRVERELRAQVEQLGRTLEDTRRALGLEPDRVRTAVDIGLDLAGKPPLRSVTLPGGVAAWQMPILGGSWAECMTGLEHPHTKAIRPLVFDEALARGRDDVVLAHLHHPLVQRCLRLLRAEVWKTSGDNLLHRVTARVVPDGVLNAPAVVAHGRLVVTGGDGDRLHEQLITAGGRVREGRFSRMGVTELDAALSAASAEPVPDAMRATLTRLWPGLRDPVRNALEARQRERAGTLEKDVRARETREIEATIAILSELEATIRRELDESEARQLPLFSLDERDQYARDKDALRRRLEQIPAEREHELAAIRRRYERTEPRLFPVAITWLIPRSLTHTGRG
ncbi:MAG: DISARM system SNF2-like helicase DrmD [Chloroflexota bacterium]|nr:DISARM system SNF2-like helicase DrmD [Chloroflexota bacterium]